MRARALAIVLLAVALLPGAQAKGLEPARAGVLDFLAAKAVAGADPLAANVAEAAAANGLDPAAWPDAQHAVAGQVDVPPADSPFIQLLRPLRALAQAGDPRAHDLEARVRAGFDGGQFGSAAALNDDAYAILALRAAGAPFDDGQLAAAAAHLRAHRNADGGWGWSQGAGSGTDMTGLVLLALEETGGASTDERRAAADLVLASRDGTGFAETVGGSANCESTAWGLRILALAGRGSDAAAWRFLLSLQQPDGGFAHRPGGGSDLLCSSEAATLLGEAQAGRVPFPSGAGASSVPSPSAGPLMLAVAGAVCCNRARLRSA